MVEENEGERRKEKAQKAEKGRQRRRKKHRKTLKREKKEDISLRNNGLDLPLENNKLACILRYLYVSLQKKGR